MLGPNIKSRDTRGTKMSANADLITVETYVQGKTIENQFLIYGPKCILFYIFGYLRGRGGGGGAFIIRLGLSCSPAILSPISMYMWNKEAI